MSNVGDVADMTKNALTILAEGNLPRFKEGALNRAKEFDITNVLPLYQNFYTKVVEEHQALQRLNK
jgi:hypothetical protein